MVNPHPLKQPLTSFRFVSTSSMQLQCYREASLEARPPIPTIVNCCNATRSLSLIRRFGYRTNKSASQVACKPGAAATANSSLHNLPDCNITVTAAGLLQRASHILNRCGLTEPSNCPSQAAHATAEHAVACELAPSWALGRCACLGMLHTQLTQPDGGSVMPPEACMRTHAAMRAVNLHLAASHLSYNGVRSTRTLRSGTLAHGG
jgi:hypothetical protein